MITTTPKLLDGKVRAAASFLSADLAVPQCGASPVDLRGCVRQYVQQHGYDCWLPPGDITVLRTRI